MPSGKGRWSQGYFPTQIHGIKVSGDGFLLSSLFIFYFTVQNLLRCSTFQTFPRLKKVTFGQEQIIVIIIQRQCQKAFLSDVGLSDKLIMEMT